MPEGLKEILIHVSDEIPASEKKKKKWEYGYNKKYDFVVISKTNTIGQIIEIDGLRIALPAIPKKTLIQSKNRSSKKQMWERQELPDDLKRIKDEDEFKVMGDAFIHKWMPYIIEENRRRDDGHWFMNNGVPIYITADHYMFLQWSKLQHIYYPEYRFPQRVIFYHLEACVADNRSLGQCYVKNRRSGYTTMMCARAVNFASRTYSTLTGLMSKNGDDAKTMFMDMVTPIFKYYPFFFKPIHDGSTNPRGELPFREPSKKITSKNKSMEAESEALNSNIKWYNSALNSMDSKEVNFQFLDEAGKWGKECPLDKYLPIGLRCVVKGARKVGISAVGSTPNAPDKGGSEFKQVYNNSKISTRDEITGQTKSKLYSLYIPCDYNYSGFFDIYGDPILQDHPEGIMNDLGEVVYVSSTTWLAARRKQLEGDPDQLNEELRMDSSTERQAFTVPSEDCLFDQNKIETQMYFNDSKFNHKTNRSNLYRRGDLVWIEKYRTVKWQTNHTKGKFLTSYFDLRGMENNVSFENGKLVPNNTQYFVGGIDSYDIKATTDGRGSNGSLHIFAKNSFQYAPNQFVLEYVDRPIDALIFYDNCYKAMVYYGCQVLIENNKSRILYEMKRLGFRKFSMNRPDRKYHQLSSHEKELGGIPSSGGGKTGGGTIEDHAEYVQQYVLRHTGVNQLSEFGEIGQMGNVYFNTLLEDWLQFDINKRTKYDRTISSGYALWGAARLMSKANTEKKQKYTWFRK